MIEADRLISAGAAREAAARALSVPRTCRCRPPPGARYPWPMDSPALDLLRRVFGFDAFRGQVTRNINTLQSQIQNLQQQINARP